MVWIGIDDTDDPDGGCTTDMFDRMIVGLLESDPEAQARDVRLVRCWPMAPERTRGNGAVACRVQTAWTIDKVMSWCIKWLEGEKPWRKGCSPACIVSVKQLDPSLYWTAVRRYVNADDVHALLDTEDVRAWTPLSKRGLVGAAAAIAWPGVSDWSWELLAYRDNVNINRDIKLEILQKFDPDPDWNGTLNKGRMPCVPNTPCPVLFGLRTRDYASLEALDTSLPDVWASPGLRSWRIFRSNQGTDDHLEGFTTGVILDKVILRGGHIRIVVDTGRGSAVWMVFRESGKVAGIARDLAEGESVEGVGLITENGDMHVESLRALTTDSALKRCDCGGTLTSMGVGQGRRCRRCRQKYARFNDQEREWKWTEWTRPAPDRRRHLSRRGKPPSLNLSL